MEKFPDEEIIKSLTGSPGPYSKLSFSIQKVTELPETRSPGPYKTIQFNSSHNIVFEISFDKNNEIIDMVHQLFTKNRKNSAGFDQDTYSETTKTKKKEEEKFDTSRIESVSEKPIITNLKVQRIHPYMQIKGYLYMTDVRIYFQPIHQVSAHPVKSVKYSDISKLYKRRWRLRNLGFEFFTKTEKSIFLAFSSENERDKTFEQLLRFVSPECQTENSVDNMMLKWQLKIITNYDYLLYLNSAAYRTFSDFTQYPVFPWVLQNYESPELDLSDASNFRDLSKPIGALNESRLESFHKLFNEMPEPKYLYGTHYSTPGHVIGFLFRKFPLAMLRLHVIFK
jgi:factor associated with neutral sphingomyelinase activation